MMGSFHRDVEGRQLTFLDGGMDSHSQYLYAIGSLDPRMITAGALVRTENECTLESCIQ